MSVELNTARPRCRRAARQPWRRPSRVQVIDLPAFSLAAPRPADAPPRGADTPPQRARRRRCGEGRLHGSTGPPRQPAASQDVLGIERTADLMSTLLGVAVSTGFVSCCLIRLDDELTTAVVEQALKAALLVQDVLGTDETRPRDHRRHRRAGLPQPARVHRARRCAPTPLAGADLVWYGAAGDRTKASISAFGILDDCRGCGPRRHRRLRQAATPWPAPAFKYRFLRPTLPRPSSTRGDRGRRQADTRAVLAILRRLLTVHQG